MVKRVLFWVWLVLLGAEMWAAMPLTHFVIKGRVTCDSKGVGGVSVSDGATVVLTDVRGRYELRSSSAQRYVFYSLPSGYESVRDGSVPQFSEPIPPAKGGVSEVNFRLLKGRDDEAHAFVVWADPQVLEEEEFALLEEVRDDLRQTMAGSSLAFHGISAGDNVFDRLHLFDAYKEVLLPLDIPFYSVIGNHDMDYTARTDEQSATSYEQAFGPSYYSFNRGRVHYVVLNDIFYYGLPYQYIGYVDEVQLRWLEQDLAAVAAGTTVVLSAHIPTAYGEGERFVPVQAIRDYVVNSRALYDILRPYRVHIMAGHSHLQWNTVVADNILEHVHGAASGAWWQGEVGLDGTPKGYTVYEVNGDELKWYFKGLNKGREEQFKFYPVGADVDHKECFVVNVYNYDPLWKVVWYEDGVRMGEMTQYWGKDPLARKLYPPGENKKHKWLGVGTTNHLFRATPVKEGAVITVEVTDRFGAVYR